MNPLYDFNVAGTTRIRLQDFFDQKDTIVIGRGEDVDVRLGISFGTELAVVSRRHAEMKIINDRLHIKTYQTSTNGTYINGTLSPPDEFVEVPDHSDIGFGGPEMIHHSGLDMQVPNPYFYRISYTLTEPPPPPPPSNRRRRRHWQMQNQDVPIENQRNEQRQRVRAAAELFTTDLQAVLQHAVAANHQVVMQPTRDGIFLVMHQRRPEPPKVLPKNAFTAKRVDNVDEDRPLDDELKELAKCFICLGDAMVMPHSLGCGHTACGTCLSKAWLLKPECPVCRDPVAPPAFNAPIEKLVRTFVVPGLDGSAKDEYDQGVAAWKELFDRQRERGAAGPP